MNRSLLLVVALGATACGDVEATDPGDDPGDPPEVLQPEGLQLALEEVVSDLTRPLFITQPSGDDRLFVAEQPGRILIVDSGVVTGTFLDIRGEVNEGSSEAGLFGLAFHPDFATNRFVYVHYTAADTSSRVVRYTVPVADSNAADPATAFEILTVPKRSFYHNGGHITFGPDGFLYVALGDDELLGNGQNTSTLVGSILRLDVDHPDQGKNYGIPPDNPFVGDQRARAEIWAFGLRNPWRFSFDGRFLYIADIGEESTEEINVIDWMTPGVNYGWSVMEGSSCFNAESCTQTGLQLPAVEYPHGEDGCAVTGGYVYRGGEIPEINGHYFYSDFCAGFLRSFKYVNDEVADAVDWGVPSPGNVSSLGLAADQLYVITFDGSVRLRTE